MASGQLRNGGPSLSFGASQLDPQICRQSEPRKRPKFEIATGWDHITGCADSMGDGSAGAHARRQSSVPMQLRLEPDKGTSIRNSCGGVGT